MERGFENQPVDKPYRVLSLDGGGMRGIYTGAFLARLTDQFGRIRGKAALDLGRGFDLITGASTGAIVGLRSRRRSTDVGGCRPLPPARAADLSASNRWEGERRIPGGLGQSIRAGRGHCSP